MPLLASYHASSGPSLLSWLSVTGGALQPQDYHAMTATRCHHQDLHPLSCPLQPPGLSRASSCQRYVVPSTGAVATLRQAQVMLLEFCQSLPGADRWVGRGSVATYL
jgi:hypothetical protein